MHAARPGDQRPTRTVGIDELKAQADDLIREVSETGRPIDIVRDGGFLLLSITANAFLHHMVRNLVGGLVYVGDGRRPVDWMAQVLASRNRSFAAPTFAACGLYLAAVRYDPAWQLPIAVKAPRICELV